MQNVETSLPDIWTKLGSEISWEMPVFKILLNFDFLVFILIEISQLSIQMQIRKNMIHFNQN